MKSILTLFLVLVCLTGLAHPPPPPAATVAETVAGTDRFKYVTPYTAAQAGFGGGGGGGISAATATNIVNANAIEKLTGTGTNTLLHSVTNLGQYVGIMGSASLPAIAKTNDLDTGFFWGAASEGGGLTIDGTVYLHYLNTSSGFGLHPNWAFSWGSSSASSTKDTFIRRGGAGIIVMDTNVLVKGGLVVSNATASSILGTTAAKAVTNITVGTGLTFDGVTLSATASGGGDTNALSYANGTDPQYTAASITSMHRLNFWFTNGNLAMVVTNNGGNSAVSLFNYSDAYEVARFTYGSSGFIDMGSYELRSAGNAHIGFTSSGTTIYDNAENPILNFENLGVPYLSQLAGTYMDFYGVVIGTNAEYMAISPLLGTVAADNAPAGTYGETQTAQLASGSAVSVTTATPLNITSISLTAGDWLVSGVVYFNPNTSATTTLFKAGISTTSATFGSQGTYSQLAVASADNALDSSQQTMPVRINVSATTTVYLVGQANFASDTLTAYGNIIAHRIR